MENIIILDRIGYSDIMSVENDRSAFFFEAGMHIDADGAYRAYHPISSKGLDYLANAGKPGNWWALVTDNRKPSGTPVIQTENDPAPGYYISATSLQDATKEIKNPKRYVDSESIPFIVLPSNKRFGAKLGNLVMVYNPSKNLFCGGVFADMGPKNKIGEASIAMAKTLDIPSNPRNGGTGHGIIYLVFPSSSVRWPLTVDEIQSLSHELFERWGGRTRLVDIFQDR